MSKYRISQNTSTNSLFVLSRLLSCVVRAREQYPIGRAFSGDARSIEEHILLVCHTHLCARCNVHSVLARTVPVVIEVFLSGYVKPDAGLPKDGIGILPLFS